MEPIRKELAGGIHYTVDEHGDAYAFCLALRAEAERLGVRFLAGSEAQIRVQGGQVRETPIRHARQPKWVRMENVLGHNG